VWIRFNEINEIRQYIPKDNKKHDIQIINNYLWVDGELKNTFRGFSGCINNLRVFKQVLTDEEITAIKERRMR